MNVLLQKVRDEKGTKENTNPTNVFEFNEQFNMNYIKIM